MSYDPVVIPAKAGIQEGEAGDEGTAGFIRWRVRWPSLDDCGGNDGKGRIERSGRKSKRVARHKKPALNLYQAACASMA